jgi:cell division protein ZapA
MDQDSHVIRVTIFGKDYPIRTSLEDEDYVREIAAYVDAKMQKIQETMNISSTSKVAILTALNIADELFLEREDRQRQTADAARKVQTYSSRLDEGLDED